MPGENLNSPELEGKEPLLLFVLLRWICVVALETRWWLTREKSLLLDLCLIVEVIVDIVSHRAHRHQAA